MAIIAVLRPWTQKVLAIAIHKAGKLLYRETRKGGINYISWR